MPLHPRQTLLRDKIQIMQSFRLAPLALLFCAASFAQVTASLSGRIHDATGSPVGTATITVRSLETGAVRVVRSDEQGGYHAVSLPLGAQEVKVEKTGFKAAVRGGLSLTVAQEAVLNFTMEVGDLAQQVTVTEEIPMINTSTASVSGVVGAREIKDLPLNGRSFDKLITLNPGTINYGLKSAGTSTSNGSTFSVAGRRPADNIVMLNGIEYTGSSQLAITPGGVSGELLGIDAVREFNVLTDAYSAEYGKRAGAQVSVVTQSGTNSVHGALFEFVRNSAFDARNFFDQGKVPPFRRNQFGGSLGGPVMKDKLFLFGNYEGFRQALAISNVSVVPNAQARQGLLPVNGVYTRVANLNTNMLKYMTMWPEANGPELLSAGQPTGTALSYNNPRQRIQEDFGTIRLDYHPREKDSISVAWTVDDGNAIIPQADPLFGSGLGLRNQVASVESIHVFSPNMINTFRAGFSRAAFNYDSVTFKEFGPELAFVTGSHPGGIVVGGGTTTTGVAAITAAGPNNAANVWNRRNLYTLSDSVHWTRGRHQISVGGWFQRMQDNENTASRRQGQASFASLTTFLQGNVTTFQLIPNPNALGWRSVFGAWYAMDSIRLLPNLTLELGLRHEFTNGWSEVTGRAANFIPDANGVLQTATRVGPNLFTKNNARKLFGPRTGIAWDVRGDGKTSIRAGFGVYYSLIDNLAFLINSVPPYNGAASFTGSLPSLVPIAPGVNPPQACGPGIPAPCTTYAPQGVQSDLQTPAVNEWNLRLEQQITSNLALRVSYVGSFGYHGFVSVDTNTIPAQICNVAAGCTSGGTSANRGNVPLGAQYVPVGSRPNPFLSGAFMWHSQGNSSYNALQTELVRRLTKGLQMRGNFTWAKNLDVNSSLTGAQANNQPQMVMNRHDLKRDWGNSALNPKFQTSVSGRWEIPVGRGQRFLSGLTPMQDKVFGGWQLNGILTMLTGFPFTPQAGANRSGNGDTRNPDRPSLNPAFTGRVIKGTQTQWYDPNAFVLPTPGTWGNLARGAYVGPKLNSLDLSLFKSVAVTERVNAQFRAEVFNALNHTNFASPNSVVFTGTAYSASAGLITSTVTQSRQLQLGLKLIF